MGCRRHNDRDSVGEFEYTRLELHVTDAGLYLEMLQNAFLAGGIIGELSTCGVFSWP